MESNAAVANEARDLGHKLSKFMSPSQPCFDNWERQWYFLDEKGGKVATDPPSYLI
jgi:glycerol uptake facilitator-like aquaporin